MAWTVWAWQCPGGRTGISGTGRAGFGWSRAKRKLRYRIGIKWHEEELKLGQYTQEYNLGA